MVCRKERPGLCLGDNAGRLELAGRPRLFQEAEARGIPVLPGSDPLPLPAQGDRAGSYGFLLPEGFDERRPAESLRQTLRALDRPPRTYGRRRDLAAFCQEQLALRLHRRRPSTPAPSLAAPAERTAAALSPWTR